MISIMRRRFVLFCFENVATKRVEENKCQHLKRLKWQTYWDKGCRNALHFDSTPTDTKLLNFSPSWAPYERRQAAGQSSSGGCSWPRLCTWLRYLSTLIWLRYLISHLILLRYFFNLALLQTWFVWEHPEWSFWTESTLKKKSCGCFWFKKMKWWKPIGER